MALTKLSLTLRDGRAADALTGLLGELEPAPAAVSLFREEATGDWHFDAYYLDAPDLEALSAAARPLLGEAAPFSLEAVPDENWVAISQAALPPVQAGRFLIHGSHDRAAAHGRPYAIEIEAGEAFGTAHHATTKGCLLAIDRLVRRRTFQSVADIGCGSGILAIGAAKCLPRAAVVAADIDPRAVAVARENARLNRVGGRIGFGVAAGFDHPLLRGQGRFDLVLANILAEPLRALAPRMRRALRPGGRAVLAGLLDHEAKKVTAAYVAAGFIVQTASSISDWTILTVVRR